MDYEELLGIVHGAVERRISVSIFGTEMGGPVGEFNGTLIAGDDVSGDEDEEVLVLYIGTGESSGNLMLSATQFRDASWYGEQILEVHQDTVRMLIDLDPELLLEEEE